MSALPLLAGAVLAALLLLFLWLPYLPMIDLPQHASQLATWIHWNDPAYPNADIERNARTPYWLAYLLARGFSSLLGVVTALELVVWLAVVGNTLSVAWLARRLGHDPWVALLAVPTAFGYAFYFGFVSFVVAVPLGVACLAAALEHSAAPRVRSGAVLTGLSCLTLAAHGVAFAIAAAASASLVVRGGGSLAARFAPLALAAVIAVLWVGDGSSIARMGPDTFDGSVRRLVELPAALVTLHSGDWLGFGLGVLVLVALGACLGRPSRLPERWAPLAIVLAGFCFFPSMVNGYAFMNGRFASFLLPALLLAFAPPREPGRARSGLSPARALPLVATLAFLLLFGTRSLAFERETRAWTAFVERIPPRLRVRSIVFDRTSSAFPGAPLFLHFAGYYHAAQGGLLGHSFTQFPNSVLRLRPGARGLSPPGSEWYPGTFDARFEVPAFDYFIVKSRTDRSRELFADSFVPVVADARAGPWWGYRTVFPGVTAPRAP